MKLRKPKLPKIKPENLALILRILLEGFFLVLLSSSLLGLLASSSYLEVVKYSVAALLVMASSYATKKL